MIVLLSLVGVYSCADRPNTAPTDFQELTSFLYEHMLDDDPEELKFGLENMYLWLNENTSSIRKGYTVKKLTAEAIATTGKNSNPSDLIGGAALTAHGHKVDMLARALGVDNVRETNGDAYVSYQRTYIGDPECFAKRECETMEADSITTSSWVGGLVEIKYDTHVQFRWVTTKYGPVMLHRSFMNKRPEINLDVIDARQGYYIGIVFPPMRTSSNASGESVALDMEVNSSESQEESAGESAGDSADETVSEGTQLNIEVDDAVNPDGDTWGKSAFLQVNWLDVDYGILPVTEARALEMLVESIISVAVATEKWMDRTYVEQ